MKQNFMQGDPAHAESQITFRQKSDSQPQKPQKRIKMDAYRQGPVLPPHSLCFVQRKQLASPPGRKAIPQLPGKREGQKNITKMHHDVAIDERGKIVIKLAREETACDASIINYANLTADRQVKSDEQNQIQQHLKYGSKDTQNKRILEKNRPRELSGLFSGKKSHCESQNDVASVLQSPSGTIMSAETSPAILAPAFTLARGNPDRLPFAQVQVRQSLPDTACEDHRTQVKRHQRTKSQAQINARPGTRQIKMYSYMKEEEQGTGLQNLQIQNKSLRSLNSYLQRGKPSPQKLRSFGHERKMNILDLRTSYESSRKIQQTESDIHQVMRQSILRTSYQGELRNPFSQQKMRMILKDRIPRQFTNSRNDTTRMPNLVQDQPHVKMSERNYFSKPVSPESRQIHSMMQSANQVQMQNTHVSFTPSMNIQKLHQLTDSTLLNDLLNKLKSPSEAGTQARTNARNVVRSKLARKTMLSKGVRTSDRSQDDDKSQVSVNRSPSPWEFENTEQSLLSKEELGGVRALKSTGKVWSNLKVVENLETEEVKSIEFGKGSI